MKIRWYTSNTKSVIPDKAADSEYLTKKNEFQKKINFLVKKKRNYQRCNCLLVGI